MITNHPSVGNGVPRSATIGKGLDRRARRTTDGTGRKSTYTGKYDQLKDAPFEPKTVQKSHPPILIGGQGPKLILPLIARHANISHLRVCDIDPEEVEQRYTTFDAICRQGGRDPAEIAKPVSLRSAQLTEASEELRR